MPTPVRTRRPGIYNVLQVKVDASTKAWLLGRVAVNPRAFAHVAAAPDHAL